MTPIGVIDHGAGNLVSIAQGLARAGADVQLLDAPPTSSSVAGLVLPGVGSTGAAMERLDAAGFVPYLRDWNGPLLGICVGLQLLFEFSDEDDTTCLGLIPGVVRRLRGGERLPHIGWNPVSLDTDPLFAELGSPTEFYFVHSFAPEPTDASIVVATAAHGAPFVAGVRTGHLAGVQFHPERSGPAGLRVLANFVADVDGSCRAA